MAWYKIYLLGKEQQLEEISDAVDWKWANGETHLEATTQVEIRKGISSSSAVSFIIQNPITKTNVSKKKNLPWEILTKKIHGWDHEYKLVEYDQSVEWMNQAIKEKLMVPNELTKIGFIINEEGANLRRILQLDAARY